MLRIGVLIFSHTLSYSYCAWVRNAPKIVTFVIGKMKLVSFGLFLCAFPPRPKMPFGQRHVPTNIYNICDGHFGSGGGGGGGGEASKNKLKGTSFIFERVESARFHSIVNDELL